MNWGFKIPFNRISVISGQWNGKHERPCAMKRRLASERISPSAGFEHETPWSDFESAKSSAMRSLLVRSRTQENVTLTTMPIIWIGIKTICPFPICGTAYGWGSGYNESVMFYVFDYFVQKRWYKWYKNHKNFIQNLVFITVDYAPVICNHCPRTPPPPIPPPHTHRRRIAGTTAFHPSQHWDLLRGIALLFIIINSTGYICIILLARHLPGTAGELKRPVSRTLAPLSTAHPRRCVCWGGAEVSGYKWLVHYKSSCLSSGK